MIVEVDTRSAPATCSAVEHLKRSDVEKHATEECYRADLEAGGNARCTFTNIVFYTSIPTLNPYGMALLVLMMLGVATVGFRRIII